MFKFFPVLAGERIYRNDKACLPGILFSREVYLPVFILQPNYIIGRLSIMVARAALAASGYRTSGEDNHYWTIQYIAS